MAAPKGHARYGGRKKGTPNRKTVDAEAKAAELGVDPFEVLLRIANGDWKGLGYEKATKTLVSMGVPYDVDNISLTDRRAAASDAAQFLMPKRKAVEHTFDAALAEQAEDFEQLPDAEKIKLLEATLKRLKAGQ